MPKAKTKTVKKVVKQTQRQTAKQVAKQTVKVVIGDVSKKKKTVSRKKAGVKVPQVVYTAPMFAPQPQPLYPTFTPTIPSAPPVSYDIPVAPPTKKPVSQEEPKPVLPEAKVEHPVEVKAPVPPTEPKPVEQKQLVLATTRGSTTVTKKEEKKQEKPSAGFAFKIPEGGISLKPTIPIPKQVGMTETEKEMMRQKRIEKMAIVPKMPEPIPEIKTSGAQIAQISKIKDLPVGDIRKMISQKRWDIPLRTSNDRLKSKGELLKQIETKIKWGDINL